MLAIVEFTRSSVGISITPLHAIYRAVLSLSTDVEHSDSGAKSYRACKLFNIRLYATLCFNYFR